MPSYNTPSRLYDFNGTFSPEGLISAWNLSNANDNFGTNNLTNNNVVTFVAGKINNAANFVAASSQSLSIADNASLSFGAGKKLFACCWFNINSLAVNRSIFGKWNGAGNSREYELEVKTTGAITFAVTPDGINITAITTPAGLIQVGVYYFVCCWYDGNRLAIELNANGIIYTQAYTGDIFNGTADFTIGTLANPSQFWDGKIDAFRIYKHDNRVLTAADRAALYNLGLGKEYLSDGNLVLKDQVNQEFDQIINILNGTSIDVTLKLALIDNVPTLKLTQQGNAAILQCKNNGILKSEINNLGQLKSYIATGTAPITIPAGATTRIDNLNVDLLDDLDSSAFLQNISVLEFENNIIFQGTINGFELPRYTTVDGNIITGIKVRAINGGSFDGVTTFGVKAFPAGINIGGVSLIGSDLSEDLSGLNIAASGLYEINLVFTGSIGPTDITVSIISKKSFV